MVKTKTGSGKSVTNSRNQITILDQGQKVYEHSHFHETSSLGHGRKAFKIIFHQIEWEFWSGISNPIF